MTCEVSPHHLWFSSEDIDEQNSAFKMNPPLRGLKDRDALRFGLKSGVIDFLATDHAPHEADVKTENFKTAAFGTTGLETSLRVLLTLWKEGLLKPEQVVKAFSSRPAAFLGIDNEYGSIQAGRECKAVLVNPYCQEAVVESDLYSLSKNNCFVGQKLTGEVCGMFLSERFYRFR